MSWTKIDSAPSRPADGQYYRLPSTDGYREHRQAHSTTALDVWKCDGCGARACGPADRDPGQCLSKNCRFAAKPEGRPNSR